MSIPINGVLLHYFVLFLVATSVSSPKWVAFGEQNFRRPDPLRHLNNYNGGYEVENKHYWASAAFTGVYGYIMAGVWLLCGLGFMIFMVFKNPNIGSNWPIKDFLDHHFLLMFILILLFTLLAIVASSLALVANQNFMKRTTNLKGAILRLAGDARKTIVKVTKVMKHMQHLLVPYDKMMAVSLNITVHRLGKESYSIRRFVENNEGTIDRAIQIPYVVHLVVVTVNLALLVAALVLLLLHCYPGFVIVIFLCWISTTLIWVLNGFDYFLDNFAKDTCSAFVDFQQNSHKSSLSRTLPCLDPSYSEKLRVEIGRTIHTFINQLNSKVNEMYKFLGLDAQNDDFPGLVSICNPFSGAPNYTYTPEGCTNSAIPIGEVPNVIAGFTCDQVNIETCKRSGKPIPKASYNLASAYSYSVQDFLNIYPTLESLSECSFVKDGISQVVSYECRPFRIAMKMLWSSMLSLAIFMVFIVLILVAKAFQDRGKRFTMCSLIPMQQ